MGVKLAFRRQPESVWIMADDQEIVQSRFGYTNRFHFGEDQLRFTSRDSKWRIYSLDKLRDDKSRQQLDFKNKRRKALQSSYCSHRHRVNDDNTISVSRPS